ncbi:MAG TPA: hypothetical protein VFH39_01810 [Candidatus Saccharimonadales bacterium]|nr:hypothetical protein [Candidatus Saccharimonadales bacterium]
MAQDDDMDMDRDNDMDLNDPDMMDDPTREDLTKSMGDEQDEEADDMKSM